MLDKLFLTLEFSVQSPAMLTGFEFLFELNKKCPSKLIARINFH